MQCVFCTMNKKQIVARNSLAYTVRDTSPVTPLRTLILPNHHIASYFDLDADEKHAIDDSNSTARPHYFAEVALA
jgi:diadenosine tetraphosphate (Ap4A) HIT family hydrolase